VIASRYWVRRLSGLETVAAHAVGVQVVTELRRPHRPTRLDPVAPPGHDGLDPIERDASGHHPDDPYLWQGRQHADIAIEEPLKAKKAVIEALDVGESDLTVCPHGHRGLVDEVADGADQRRTTGVPRTRQRGARHVADFCEMADLLLLRGQPRQRRATQDNV
jgi:hypothetical protein